MAPIHVIIPGTCEWILAYMENRLCKSEHIKDLEMGDHPELSSWTQCDHKSPYKRKGRREKGNMMMEAEIGVILYHWLQR